MTRTNLVNLIEFVLCPDPQALGGHGTFLMFSPAHFRKDAAPPKFTNMGKLWLNDVRGGQYPVGLQIL